MDHLNVSLSDLTRLDELVLLRLYKQRAGVGRLQVALQKSAEQHGTSWNYRIGAVNKTLHKLMRQGLVIKEEGKALPYNVYAITPAGVQWLLVNKQFRKTLVEVS